MNDVRRRNLLTLLNGRYLGDRQKFLADAHFSEPRLSQLLKPGAVFGERVARSLEEKLNLPPMYFDDEGNHHKWPADVIEGAKLLASMSASDRRKALAILGALSTPEGDAQQQQEDGSRH